MKKIVRNRITVMGLSVIIIFVIVKSYWKNKRIIEQLENEKNRYKNYYSLLCQWIRNGFAKEEIDKKLREKNIYTIAIYGYGVLGRLLFYALEGSDIKVLYFIDRNADNVVSNLSKSLTADKVKMVEKPDAIIVSLSYDYNAIKEQLFLELGEDYKVISLENLIYNI